MTKETLPTKNEENDQTDWTPLLMENRFVTPRFNAGKRRDSDLRQTIQQALQSPLHFPPLDQSVFPGDRIAITLSAGLPSPNLVLNLLLENLAAAGIEFSDIVVLIHPAMASAFQIENRIVQAAADVEQDDFPATFPVTTENWKLNFHLHNPHNNSALSYLLASEAGDPIHANRLLVDADLILPVGFAMPQTTDVAGDCLYPQYASAAVNERFASGIESVTTRQSEVRETNNILGSFFAIQIVTRPGGQIEQVYAGARADVISAAQSKSNEYWKIDLSGEFDFVLATVETPVSVSAWDDFVAALLTANQVSKSKTPVVIWSELDERPPRSLSQAFAVQFDGTINKKWTAELKQVAEILANRPVFLRSRLTRDKTEQLGLGFIESIGDVLRISESCSRSLFLRDAHLCQVNP